MCRITHRCTKVSLVVLVGVCLGFYAPDSTSYKDPPRIEIDPAPVLTPERARQAISALVEAMPGEDQAYFQLSGVHTGDSIAILDQRSERYFTTHTWNCLLKERWFVFSGPFRPHGCHREDHGVFECVGGRWKAHITGRSWGCSK
jgi:hypothetical protein